MNLTKPQDRNKKNFRFKMNFCQLQTKTIEKKTFSNIAIHAGEKKGSQMVRKMFNIYQGIVIVFNTYRNQVIN